jgi:hypothetical protein
MTIINFTGDIHKDTSVLGNNTYYGNGQGCGTIWYKNVPSARRATQGKHPALIKRGSDFYDCAQCGCHYPYPFGSVAHHRYAQFACKKAKEKYAERFNK